MWRKSSASPFESAERLSSSRHPRSRVPGEEGEILPKPQIPSPLPKKLTICACRQRREATAASEADSRHSFSTSETTTTLSPFIALALAFRSLLHKAKGKAPNTTPMEALILAICSAAAPRRQCATIAAGRAPVVTS
jgi:hypothetical protein